MGNSLCKKWNKEKKIRAVLEPVTEVAGFKIN